VSLIQSDYDVIDYEAGADNELRGMECVGCYRLLTYRSSTKTHLTNQVTILFAVGVNLSLSSA